MEKGGASRMMSSVTSVLGPNCQPTHSSRVMNPGAVTVTLAGLAGGDGRAPSEYDPSAPVETAARSQLGVTCAPETGCCATVSTTRPAIDQLFEGVGGEGAGVGVVEGGVELDEPPPHEGVHTRAHTTNTTYRLLRTRYPREFGPRRASISGGAARTQGIYS